MKTILYIRPASDKFFDDHLAGKVPGIRGILGKESDHFEKSVFSEGERTYCRARKDPMPHFAARFAAKEAYGKALGLGLGPTGESLE